MIQYIKALQPSALDQTKKPHPDLIISTKDGYPWLPPVKEGVNQTKEELEKLLQTYLNEHYRKCILFFTFRLHSHFSSHKELASGRKRNHVAFKALSDNTNMFIDGIYIPRGFK